MTRTLVLCLVLMAAAAPAGANTAGVVLVAAADFHPEEVTVLEGSSLYLVNADYPGEQSSHDLVSPEGLFASEVTSPAEAAEVAGVQSLPAGRYPFRCSVHPVTMTGILVVA